MLVSSRQLPDASTGTHQREGHTNGADRSQPELFHRTQTHPSHPPVIVSAWGDHSEKKIAGNTVFTSKALSIALSDHAGTHVDAPVHFDPRPGALSIDEVPLENFYT